MYRLASTALRNVDPTTTLTNPLTLVQIALAVRDVPFDEIVFVQYPTNTAPSDPNRVVPNYTAAEPLWQRSEEHTSELQSLMRSSYAVFCLKNKKETVCTHETEDDLEYAVLHPSNRTRTRLTYRH